MCHLNVFIQCKNFVYIFVLCFNWVIVFTSTKKMKNSQLTIILSQAHTKLNPALVLGKKTFSFVTMSHDMCKFLTVQLAERMEH